jgi:peptide/nickel transport system substrate-binding protein
MIGRILRQDDNMSRSPSAVVVMLLFSWVLSACGPSATPAPSTGAAPAGQPTAARPSEPQRPLVVLTRLEPTELAARPLRQGGSIFDVTKRLFNANLVILDDKAVPHPYLAEALPQLNTDSWKVFPDGRMETTYRLKPNLTWQDGQPLTAEDFVFAWRVYVSPDLGFASTPPTGLMDEVVAVDPRTVLIRWARPYPEAGALTELFPPFPRHLLASSFETGPNWADGFLALPFWTREYIGLGPFKVDRWEPGVEIQASAFPGHVLGAPKIARLIMRWNGDPNAALANFLAGEAHVSADSSIQTVHANTLKRAWEARNEGTILFKPDLWRAISFQFRPELTTPAAILDPRVRKAIAHAVDKSVINEVEFEGEGIMTETIIPPMVDYFPTVERAIAKYPLDLRRSEQLMGEAGFTRGGDGMYASSATGRLNFEVKTNASAQFEQQMSILADGWRRAGFDFREVVNPAALAQNSEVRATFPSLFTFSSGGGERALITYTSAFIPREENRWNGANRGGWSNAEFDRLVDRLNGTLDRIQRGQIIADMARVYNDDLPAISIYFQPSVFAHVSALRGPKLVAPESSTAWNVYEWEFR